MNYRSHNFRQQDVWRTPSQAYDQNGPNVRAFRHCLFCDHTNGNRPPNFEPWSDEEADTSARTVNSKRFSVLQALLHGCSSASAESGFEPGTLRHRSEILPPGQLGP
ncbi:hypothetical protein AVEN_15914-1 [Araneus ventricosus]|uniref:Uncharacterized protein n=1 Tax=Araneus ventricosus TaxID=182803 RepID=A0A4Y2QVU0_ARAVE|nr:hypothetical protein AVEN_73013-1 [Araneus ventricosus]GBN67475.1 hypothetical protein AVEN_15914-1 [Araneus ventricosus]